MSMISETRELISALYDHGAEFLVVGGHAMAAHGWPRATGDFRSPHFAATSSVTLPGSST
jgi:hypothetical protein